MAEKSELPKPPRAPEIKRHLHFYPWQWIGIPVLLGIPILAMFGMFGESFASATGNSPEVGVAVEYPTRFRYKMINSINVRVRNVSPQPIDTLSVGFSPDYMTQFSTLSAIPSFSETYLVEMLDLKPGEESLVRVEIQGEEYGRHQGEIIVTSGGADTASVPLSTFIFP